jgi:hypothetical protein
MAGINIYINSSYPYVVGLNEIASFSVTITNDTDKALPADTQVRHCDSHYGITSVLVGAVSPYSCKKISLSITPHDGASIHTLSSTFLLGLESQQGAWVSSTKSTFIWNKLNRYIGNLKSYNKGSSSSEPLNFLVYGKVGSGKSSFIQTILTLLSSDDKPNQYVTAVGIHNAEEAAEEEGSSDAIEAAALAAALAESALECEREEHNTHGFSSRSTTHMNMHDLPELNCKVWDTWGLNGDTYKHNELEWIVQGLLPSGWSMEEVKPNAEIMLRDFRTKDLRRQHAVLFFLTAPMFEDVDEMEHAKRQFAKISSMGLNPIIVIARADEIDTSIRAAPMAKCAEIEAWRKRAAWDFSIPLSRVHISVPYCAEEKRVFDIERQAYKLLDAVMQAAVEFKTIVNKPDVTCLPSASLMLLAATIEDIVNKLDVTRLQVAMIATLNIISLLLVTGL